MPIAMLTARGDAMNRIVGLELGADDYLPRPFNPSALLARLKAVYVVSAVSRSTSPIHRNPAMSGFGLNQLIRPFNFTRLPRRCGQRYCSDPSYWAW